MDKIKKQLNSIGLGLLFLALVALKIWPQSMILFIVLAALGAAALVGYLVLNAGQFRGPGRGERTRDDGGVAGGDVPGPERVRDVGQSLEFAGEVHVRGRDARVHVADVGDRGGGTPVVVVAPFAAVVVFGEFVVPGGFGRVECTALLFECFQPTEHLFVS